MINVTNGITQIGRHQRGFSSGWSVIVQDASLLKWVFFWCLLTARWPGRVIPEGDEIYFPSGFDTYLKFQIVAWLSLFCILIAILAVNAKIHKAVYAFFTSPCIKWFVIYLGWATICIIWSVSPKLSAFFVIKAWAIVIAAALIYMRITDSRQATRLICYYGGLTSLAAIISCVLWPNEFDGRLGPPLFSGLSIIVSMSLLFSLNRAISEDKPNTCLWAVASLFFFLVVLLTRGRSVIAFTILVVSMAARHCRRGKIIIAFMIALLCLLIVAYPSELWQLYYRSDLADVSSIDQLKGLHGRVELWTFVVRQMLNRDYLLGKGYVAGSRDWFSKEFVIGGGNFNGQNPHNPWLTAWVEMGFPGFVVAIVLYYSLIRNAYLSIQKKWFKSGSVRYSAGWSVILFVLLSLIFSGLTTRPVGWLLPVLLCMRWIVHDRETGSVNNLTSHYSSLVKRRDG